MNSRLSRFVSLLLAGTVIVLCVLGILAGVGRWVDARSDPMWRDRDPAFTARQHEEYALLAWIAGIAPGSARDRHSQADLVEFNRNFVNYPIVTLLHVGAGALFLAFAPLQFSSKLRRRFVRLHRWSGRVLLALSVPIGLSAFFFGLLMPFAGVSEAIAIALFGGFFSFAALRAFIAIRRVDVARHREWMIRMFSIAVGISTIRVIGLALAAFTDGNPKESFALSLWIGWILSLAVAELWIRASRANQPRVVRVEAAPAGLSGQSRKGVVGG